MSQYLLDDYLRCHPEWWRSADWAASGQDWHYWLRQLPAGKDGVRALSRDWVMRRRDPLSCIYTRRDDIMDYCAEAGTLFGAVQRACQSWRPNGKLHNHQSRVPAAVRKEYARRIAESMRQKRWLQLDEQSARSMLLLGHDEAWRQLWRVCEVAGQMPGIGPVTQYDVATRIGAYLRVYPSAVYLKAGTLDGTRALAAIDPRPVYGYSLKAEVWMPVQWYKAFGMGPIINYGNSLLRHDVGCPADALEDALCTLREPFKYLTTQRDMEQVRASVRRT